MNKANYKTGLSITADSIINNKKFCHQQFLLDSFQKFGKAILIQTLLCWFRIRKNKQTSGVFSLYFLLWFDAHFILLLGTWALHSSWTLNVTLNVMAMSTNVIFQHECYFQEISSLKSISENNTTLELPHLTFWYHSMYV